MPLPASIFPRVRFHRLPLVVAVFSLCTPLGLAPSPGLAQTPEQSLVSVFGGTPEYWTGFCKDVTPAGVAVSPLPRPRWSALASSHYDGLGSRYPDYRNVSKNLAILQTLQFLLSVTTNLIGQIDHAHKQVTELDQNLIAPPGVGHCICANKPGCDPTKILATVDQTINKLVDQQHIDQVFSAYLTQQVQAALNDLNGLDQYLEALTAKDGAPDQELRLSLELTVKKQIVAAALKMKAGPAASCDPTKIPTYDADVAAAVEEADKALRAQIDLDAKQVEESVTRAATLKESTLQQIKKDIQELRTLFAGVHSAKDLARMDWAATKKKLDTMVSFYQDAVADIVAKAKALDAIWNDLSKYPTLAERATKAIHDQLQKTNVKNCVAALDEPASYKTAAYKPADFTRDFKGAVQAVVQKQWLEALAHIDLTIQSLIDRLAGAGAGTTAVAVFDQKLSSAAAAITQPVRECYGRDTRPACFKLCNATGQGDFLWLPVDFLQDPQKAATGVPGAAMFALKQAGWLDQVSAWAQSQSGLQKDLATRLGAAKMALSGIATYLQQLQKTLGTGLGYVDRFTEGYHLGGYQYLRSDLNHCIAYAGSGPYAQLGGVGNDDFSLGARFTSHNLSAGNLLQLRTGGFAVSAFGHDLSLAPTLEVTAQIDGFRLWNQRSPLGIPVNGTLKIGDVKKLDVFNVVPMDKYPFGFDASVPLGAAIVRDLMPSRRTPQASPDWPRPGVTAPWESQSTAGVSLGLNLGFDLGPERYDLAEIDVIPRLLVAIPWFQISAGVNWTQQTNLFRDRIQEMVNVNLPAAVRLTDKDFQREMHAFAAPDLSDDDRTSVYVEPTLGVDAFLGFRIWRIDIGAGAGIGLAVNLRPGGQGGVLDLSTPLADAVLVSNPPANADCKPVWAFDRKVSCSNKAFSESKGSYACEALDGRKSCCIQAVWPGGRESFCLDDWTGLTESDCKNLNIPNATIPKIEAAVPGWKWLAGFKAKLTSLLDRVGQVQLSGTWNATICAASTCATRPLFTTAGLDISGISQCETFGRCTYPDGKVKQDVTLADCEHGDDEAYREVSTTCALKVNGAVVCWGLPEFLPPSGRFLALSSAVSHACGVREDQTLACWGQIPAAQATPPTGTFAAVTTGPLLSCALRTSGEVACWGELGKTVVPGGTFRQVNTAKNRLACGVHTDGSIECWGEDWWGAKKPFQGTYTVVRPLGPEGACALRADGGVACYLAPGSDSTCDRQALLATPSPIFGDIVVRGSCAVCGLRPDGSVQCWGKTLPILGADIRLTSVAGDQFSEELCGLLANGDIKCVFASFPARVASGSFSPYSCRSVIQESVKGWQGDGCHPLQQGFPSACACDTDAQCSTSEHCDAPNRTCIGAGSAALSCLADQKGACPNGRISVGGACAHPCQAKVDCAGSQVCEQRRCVPPGHIPLAEQIAWGMAHPQAPRHTISTYALSDFKATLLLKTDLYIEASFKLFRKPRVWRLFDYHNAWDLGSTWKGWYAPGLEARYQSECENPRLDEPVTNRYPRSATGSPFEAIFAVKGVEDPSRNCGFLQGGGVCRYPQTLPTRQDRPELYARGNAGKVSELLRWCGGDLPRHVEDPAPSENSQLSAGISDSMIWGKTVALDVWGRNRMCVNGVLWDDWLNALDGKGGSGGALEQMSCGYRNPRTGQSYSFPCKDASEAMLEIWGCSTADANPFAIELVKQFPKLAVAGLRTNKQVVDLGQVFSPGSPLTPESMESSIRFAIASPGTGWVSRLGERWLEAADQCFGSRFEDPAENVCRCNADSDCNRAAGERCTSGRCEQPRTRDGAGKCLKPDCSPVYQARQCPLVFLDAPVGPCCGDGQVEKTDRYSEECDAGPAGSTACTPQCKARGSLLGACCTSASHCADNVPQTQCTWQWHAGQTCRDVDFCRETGGGEPRCTATPSNLALWLPLDESKGPTAFNAVARIPSTQGTHLGGPTPLAAGKVAGALCFDGRDDHVDVPVYPDISFLWSNFSLNAWVLHKTVPSGIEVLIDRRTDDELGAVRGYSLFLSNGQIGLQLADGTFDNYLSQAKVPGDGLWHHVAVTVNRSNPAGGHFYLDGQPAGPAFNPTRHPGSLNTPAPFRLGARSALRSSGAVSAVLQGCLDEVEAFRRVLSPAEVLSIYHAGAKGTCKQSCSMRGAFFCGAQSLAADYSEICNYRSVPQSFDYSFQGLPVQSGCSIPGPVSFTPASGTTTVQPGKCNAVESLIGRPAALPEAPLSEIGGCYQMFVQAPATQETLRCEAGIWSVCSGI